MKTKKKKKVISKKRKYKRKEVKVIVEQQPVQSIELDYIPLGKCRACKKAVKDTDFKNSITSFNKFASSGLCLKCQTEEMIDEQM